MKYCKNCILPDSRPNLVFTDGVCDVCSAITVRKSLDWSKRELQFLELAKKITALNCEYDCLIPVSGGKDSTWQVIVALEYGLKPLCVTWRSPARNSLGQKNLENLIALGVDHIDFTINPYVEKKFTLKALKSFGSPAIPMHMAIHSIPVRIAIEKQIPLVLWGENSAAEYGGSDKKLKGNKLDRAWLKKYGVTNGTTAEDWVGKDLTQRELAPYYWPTEAQLKSSGVQSLFLGEFFRWDPRLTAEIAASYGFKAADNAIVGLFDFADIDDAFIMSVHHWLKWYKFGFTRTWDNLSIDIRKNRITRSDAINKLSEIGDETPHEAIGKLCSYLEISEKDFYIFVEKFRNREIWQYDNQIWSIQDYLIDKWNWENDSR